MDATMNVVRAESCTVIEHSQSNESGNQQDDAATIAAAKQAKRDAAAKLALETASTVARGALRGASDDERVLDPHLVFGDLLASAAHKWVCFGVGGATIHLKRSKLAEVGRVMRRRRDLFVTVDKQALRIRWNGGRGGLNFVSQDVTREDRTVTLDVVFPHVPALVAAPEPVAPAAPARVRSADEQTACADAATCELAAPEACVRATTRWQAFQSYREIAELVRPALASATAGAPVFVDAAVIARVQALLGGAASRDQADAITTPAALCACA